MYYDSFQDAMYFTGNEEENKGIAIKTLNYVNNNSDQLNELSLIARVKLKTNELSRGNDQRIIFTMDRSENFRFSVGSDYNTNAKGKLAFHFNVNGTVFDTHAVSQTLDLRDEKWHTVGVTFKANTDDMRESSSLVLIPYLLKKGAIVRYYDPSGFKEEFKKNKNLKFERTLANACVGADLIIINTEWDEFKSIDFKKLVKKNNFKVYDMRNLYNPTELRKRNIKYYSVGRQ